MAYSRLLQLFAALILLSTATAAWGQGFRKTYGIANSQFNDVLETPDGGFFLVGTSQAQPSLFQLTDRVGTPIWAAALPLNGAEPIAACQVPDGGFVALAEYYNDGGEFKNLVVKLSPTGTVQWQTVVASPNMENGLKDLVALPDGSVVVVGSTRPNFANQEVRLLKINADGSLAWSQTFGEATLDEFAARIVAAPGGGFVVGGFSAKTSGGGLDVTDFFLAKTDPDGNLLWQKTYPKPGSQYGRGLIGTLDGGFVLVGETQQTNPVQATVLKTDAGGNELWFKQFNPSQVPDSKLLEAHSIAEDQAGNLYLPAVITASPNSGTDSSFIAQLSPSGVLAHLKWLSYPDRALQIIGTHDHKLALAGWVAGSGPYRAASLAKLDQLGEVYGNYIAGSLFHDLNDNCTQDGTEPPLPRFRVEAKNAEGHIFYGETAANGSYKVLVSEGDFELTVRPEFGQPEAWKACDTPSVAVSGIYQTFQAPLFGVRSLSDCPALEVEIGAGFMRRCTTTRFTVNYCNAGNATATDAYVVLSADDKFSYVASSVPVGAQNGQQFWFNLGNVPLGACGSFTADFKVSCDASMSEVLCMDAHIFPDSLCAPPGAAAWDGSHLTVQGECDGEVKFTFQNTGKGDMAESVEYVIIEDQIIFMQSQIQLNAGGDTTITVSGTPNGKSYYLSTTQAKGYPGNSHPSATVQGCGGSGGVNLLMQLPQSQGNFTATYCDEVRGSFDPNDKRGFPMGWQEQHFIERNQPLDYMIRFQNTGNDTAFLVILLDTLSPLLDPSSVRPGASSHPYLFDLSSEGILSFRFPNILLADSNVNEAASHGYVRFRVEQRKDLPLGSRIENRAGIYFDFNEPVMTNTAFHTVGEPLISFAVDRPSDLVGLSILPNPMADEALFRLQTPVSGADLRLSLFDATGRTVRDETFVQPEHRFQRRGLLPGMYFFTLKKDGAVVASGKVALR